MDGVVIEKRVLMPHGQNTVHITYRLLEGDGPVRLDAPAVGALPAATRRRSTPRPARSYTVIGGAATLRGVAAAPDLPPLRCCCTATRRR